ncbi:MAG: DUF3467 domain-containing protein [Candidatus Brocadiaceae bacterium]|nr:DUF3467 domain-containing protein [Candidatus Brocadiaceae bacterium]
MKGSDKHEGFSNKEIVEGRYANIFKVGQNAFEFVIDFGQAYGECGCKKEHFHTRIICNPFYASRFLTLLRDSIDRYEEEYGKIPQEQHK